MTSAAAVVWSIPQIHTPGSNSSDERTVLDTVVQMTGALLAAHKNVEKSTTMGDSIKPMNLGGDLCVATPNVNVPMNVRKATDGCDGFSQTADGNDCNEDDNVKCGGYQVESLRIDRNEKNYTDGTQTYSISDSPPYGWKNGGI